MRRIGVKCEIHNCSIEFMKRFLKDVYNKKDMEMIEKAFNARINLQYYTNKPVDSEVINQIKKYCKEFFIKTKDILISIDEKQINSIRKEIKKRKY